MVQFAPGDGADGQGHALQGLLAPAGGDHDLGRLGQPLSPTAFFAKHGAYVELEQPITADLDLVARVDGLLRLGNVSAASPLSNRALLLRYTLGASYAVTRGVRIKVAPELWHFDYADATGRKLEGSLHLAIVCSL